MCGDTHCWSCGPAQGNSKCSVCGKWADDGGCDNPAECERIGKEQDDAYAKQIEEEREIEARYVAELRNARNRGQGS
jgi:hypothetical protein